MTPAVAPLEPALTVAAAIDMLRALEPTAILFVESAGGQVRVLICDYFTDDFGDVVWSTRPVDCGDER